ncbi:hypothetical protein [Sandarakinorhabdus sp. DWP1-3-1]
MTNKPQPRPQAQGGDDPQLVRAVRQDNARAEAMARHIKEGHAK